MTILEIMERSNIRDTKLCIAWIKDAFNAIQSTQRAGGKARVKKMDIAKGTREYNLALGERRASAAKNYLISNKMGTNNSRRFKSKLKTTY